MKYLFILGRNVELSQLEIKSYFKKNSIELFNEFNKLNGFLVNIDKNFADGSIKNLGGTISIGEVLAEGTKEEIFGLIDEKEIYVGEKNNINFCLWNFSESEEEVLRYLKKRFKSEKLKAVFKPSNDKMDLQSGEKVNFPGSKNLDEEYFVFENEEIVYFGQITQKSDYEEIERRDMEKPVRRESLAISPRLAKILINLSEVKEGEKLVDPFCGIGVVLEEALNQGIKVIGIDRDKRAIEGAKKNLEWFKFDKDNYDLFNEDSRKVEISESQGIATEPDLGQILRKTPTKENAKKTLREFEILMSEVLNNLKKKVSGKFVFTSPLIRVGKKRKSCNIEDICEATGLNLIGEGIDEFRENQIVGRRIFVLEHTNN
ncbi:MAG: methyltransferase domain-containing protein [Nanoarchaeota archaeon]|nr:methyltransferase domain-containing protein [Nanoarchaeota archaeon]